jgi:hypothetical protein
MSNRHRPHPAETPPTDPPPDLEIEELRRRFVRLRVILGEIEPPNDEPTP